MIAGLRGRVRALALALLLLVEGPQPRCSSRRASGPKPLQQRPTPGRPATTGLEVALVTVGPGQIYWERFGHNAIVIRDRASGAATLYHFGIFDFESENFLLNFLRGRMTLPSRSAQPLRELRRVPRRRAARSTCSGSRSRRRSAATLRDFLEWHVAPENARYRYDYYVRNCSTKMRDALDLATRRRGPRARSTVARAA